jgi:tetratricopeptide (TPR) repeat protein
MQLEAERLNQQGLDLEERGEIAEAEACYRAAAAADPEWAAPLYNLGLLCKNARRWQESESYNQWATQCDPTNEGAWWNLGIAATALGHWDAARAAWEAFGIDLPEGTGPIAVDLGITPIRISPAAPEVLWCERINPAQARILSVPTPESGRHHKDLILHDGAPNGYRHYRGQQLAVFDELDVSQHSPYATYAATVTASCRGQIEDLYRAAAHMGAAAEDWTGSVEMICQACSEGIPHEHERPPEPAWTDDRYVGIAATTPAAADALLSSWIQDNPTCHVTGIELVLATTAQP